MRGIFVFVITFLATTVVGETCKVLRNIEVVVEMPSSLKGNDRFRSTWAVNHFLRSLQKRPKGACWQIRSRVLDSDIRSVSPDGTWTQKQDRKASSVEKNTNKLLKIIAKETNFAPHLPRKLIVLLLNDETQRNFEVFHDHVKMLQELNCVFLIVNVGSSQLTPQQVTQFRKITRSEYRILPVERYQQLKKNSAYFKHLRSLFEDPLQDFPQGVPWTLGPVRDRGIGASRFQDWVKCNHPVDVGFMLDGSGSAKEEYGKQKDFVKGLVHAFGLSEEGTHAGIIQYSKTAKLAIKLNQHTDMTSFEKALDALKPRGLTTRIDLALELARDKFFTPENGSRPGKMKLLILVTDGKQWKKNAAYRRPDLIADDLRQLGVTLLVVGVGHEVDDTELAEISGPDDNWRKVEDFRELTSRGFVERMTRKSCDLALGRECTIIVDLCFIMDSSGSIDEETDYEKMKEFVIRIANSFELSEGGAHGSLVVFSDFISEEERKEYSKVTVYLKDNKTPTQFRRAVEESLYFGYRTRIDIGFQLAEKDVFNVRHGARPNGVKKVIILLTDGQQKPESAHGIPYDPIEASQKLYDQGIQIYAVGIGNSINRTQLEKITRSKDRVFYAHNFDQLESQKFVRNVSTTACRSVNRPRPGTWTPWGVPGESEEPCARPEEVMTGSTCKGGCPVFHNIFNLNLGPSYVMNGVQLGNGGRGHTLDGQCAGNRCQRYNMKNMDIQQLMNVIQLALGGMSRGNTRTTRNDNNYNNYNNNNHNNNYNNRNNNYNNNNNRFRNNNINNNNNFRRPQPRPEPTEEPEVRFGGRAPNPCGTPGAHSLSERLCTEAPFIGGGVPAVEGPSPTKPSFPTGLLPDSLKEGAMMEDELPLNFPMRMQGPPAIVGRHRRRARRSLRKDDTADFSTMKKISKVAGCGLFVKVLEKYGLLSKVSELRRNGKEVTVFCPLDVSVMAMYEDNELKEKDVIFNHIAIKHDAYSTMYHTLAGQKIILDAVVTAGKNTTWKANGVDVIVGLVNDDGTEIDVISEVIRPVTRGILEALRDNPDVSIFYTLLKGSRMSDVFASDVVTKVCFMPDVCVPLSQSMSNHISKAIDFEHFTVLAPTNAVLEKMPTAEMEKLTTNKDALLDYLQRHVFLGSIGGSGTHRNQLGASVSPQHLVLSSKTDGQGTKLLTSAGGLVYKVMETVKVREGLLQVVQPQN